MGRLRLSFDCKRADVFCETIVLALTSATDSVVPRDAERRYMDTMHGAVADSNYYMKCFFDETADFLTPIALITAAKAMDDGKQLVAGNSVFAHRMDIAKLAVYYPMLLRWEEMQRFAANESLPWPIEQTKKAALDWFVSFGSTLKPQPLTHLNEGGTHDLAWFKKTVMNESLDPANDPDRFMWDQAVSSSAPASGDSS